MEKRGSIPEIDPLLRPFLQSSDDAESERLLAGLVSNHASPVIKEAIWFKLRALSRPTADGVQHQEAEDIHSEAILHLVARLRDLQKFRGLTAKGGAMNYAERAVMSDSKLSGSRAGSF
jgi:hypothetical protein